MNEELIFEEILYSEGGSGAKRWMAIDLCFKKGGGYFRARFFAPETFRDRRIISDTFRNFFNVMDVSYDDVPFCHEWYSLAAAFKEMMEDKKGMLVYGKLITRKDREVLGITLPVFSKVPDLQYSSEELMFMQEMPKLAVLEPKGNIKLDQKDKTRKRNNGELPY